jgi:hypothetical protein
MKGETDMPVFERPVTWNPKSWINEHDIYSLPVQVVGVQNGALREDGLHDQKFRNIYDALVVFPDLNPYVNGKRFTWAMRGEIDGAPAMRFETWKAEAIYSA